jgi:thiol-disulfide isomerase/thioredoxin
MLSRRSILISALLTTAVTLTPAFALNQQPFDANQFADAQRTGRPILVAVHASWCTTCKAQTHILQQLTADPKFKNLAYFVIDFDSQKELVRRFNVQLQSTLIAFKGDKEEGRSVGDTNWVAIADLLNKTL